MEYFVSRGWKSPDEAHPAIIDKTKSTAQVAMVRIVEPPSKGAGTPELTSGPVRGFPALESPPVAQSFAVYDGIRLIWVCSRISDR